MGFRGSVPPPEVVVNNNVPTPSVTVQPSVAAVTVQPSAAAVTNQVAIPANQTTTNLYGVRLFGNGADGDVTISAGQSVTLTRDMAYNNLTVQDGGVLCTSGWMVQVAGTLTTTGTGRVHNDGGHGSDAVYNQNWGLSAGSGGKAGRFSGGGSGGTNGHAPNGNAMSGTAGSQSSSSTTDIQGGSGGNGGTAGTSSGSRYAGGYGGSCPAVATIQYADTTTLRTQAWAGGGGGGGGAASGYAQSSSGTWLAVANGNTGATGGGGAGVVVIFAKSIANNGVISARGGAGGKAENVGAGGGGGGGGGVIVLCYSTFSGNAPDVSGGPGGLVDPASLYPYGVDRGADGAYGKFVELIASNQT